MVDMCNDVALHLAKCGLGVYIENNPNNTIQCDFSQPDASRVICLFQQGGTMRGERAFGDVRNPRLHIEYKDSSPVLVKQKLIAICDMLEQEFIEKDNAIYYFRLLSEPVVFPVNTVMYKGAVNIQVRQYIK